MVTLIAKKLSLNLVATYWTGGGFKFFCLPYEDILTCALLYLWLYIYIHMKYAHAPAAALNGSGRPWEKEGPATD